MGYSGNTDTVEQDEGGFPGQSAAGDTNPPASQAGVSAAAEPGRNDDCPNSAQASRSAGSAATQVRAHARACVYLFLLHLLLCFKCRSLNCYFSFQSKEAYVRPA